MMDRVVIVAKPTRLEELILKHQTEGMAGFVLESKGESISPYQDEHSVYMGALAEVRRGIPNDLTVASVSRSNLPEFLFRDNDLVVACGPDGLLVNLAQYVRDQLVIGVNPDRSRIAGNLMPLRPADVETAIKQIKAGKHSVDRLPLVKASTTEDKEIWGINDIFFGRRDHVSARYKISFAGKEEHHSSDGVIVSTGVGANGWLRSIVAMVNGLITVRNGHSLAHLPGPTSLELVFVAQNPFPSPTTGASIVTGRILGDTPLLLTSEMPHGGVIFSDGIIERGIEWPAGSTVKVTVGDRFVNHLAW